MSHMVEAETNPVLTPPIMERSQRRIGEKVYIKPWNSKERDPMRGWISGRIIFSVPEWQPLMSLGISPRGGIWWERMTVWTRKSIFTGNYLNILSRRH